jgi:hypothetical protein
MFDVFKKESPSKIVTTVTDEIYLPTRVYYKIHNNSSLRKALRKLKCVHFSEEDTNCFTIFYYKEAKNLDLAIHYQNIEKEFYPIYIANCSITSNAVLRVDTESTRRAVEIMKLLVKNIPYNLMESIFFAHMNKAFLVKEGEDFDEFSPQDYDNAFDDLVCDDDSKLLNMLLEFDPDHGFALEQKNKGLKAIGSFTKQEKVRHLDAEKISIKCSRADYHHVLNMLAFRAVINENVVYKHFEGHKDYTFSDAIQEINNRTLPDN